jgi:hypothetical protein
MKNSNHTWWGHHIKRLYIPQVIAFGGMLETRLLPSFSNLDVEADEIAKNTWEDPPEHYCYESYDEGDLAELAFNEGLSHFTMMNDLRQGVVNMTAVALYHLFEQQIMELHKKCLLNINEEKNIKLHKMSIVWERLSVIDINAKLFSCWSSIEELRLIANTVKHAEGDSAAKLHYKRPELFVAPSIRSIVGIDGARNVSVPLVGDGLYVSEEDISQYTKSVEMFWNTLSELLCHA